MWQDTHLAFKGNAEEPSISLLHVIIEVPPINEETKHYAATAF